MPAIREIEWEPCLLERQPCPELEQRFQRETGRPGRMMQYFEGCPWLADAMVRFSVQVTTHVYIDADLADQVGLVVSQDNSCRFCFGMQRAFLRVLGMSEARIARLEQDHLTGDFTPRERAALDFARRISRSRPLVRAEDTRALVEQGFSGAQIRELAAMTAVHLFFNRVSTLGALPPQAMEHFPDRWWVRLARPLIAFRFRHMRRLGKTAALTPAERSGACAPIVNALDGLPLAADLHAVLEAMWQSSPLPGRSVSLIFAVVARALGSTHCESEARRQLAGHGLGEDEVDQVLAHLSSPRLSEQESVLVPFARETVWYQPAQIQRRCADIQQRVGKPAFLHFLGIVSLVNAICRIGFVVDLEQ